MKLLDLFSCAGGAGRGYREAGFYVVGVDIVHPTFYGGNEFVRADAFEYLEAHGNEFDFIHASPPCQNDSALTRGNRQRAGWEDNHTDLVTPIRQILKEMSIPSVVENVQGSGLRRDLTLCGLMFDLKVFRHRYFELNNWKCTAPEHPTHAGHRVSGWRHGRFYEGDMVAVYGKGGGKGSISDWQKAMGIDWTAENSELREAIPPAYTNYIGEQLLNF